MLQVGNEGDIESLSTSRYSLSSQELRYVPSVSSTTDSAYETLPMPSGFNFTIQIHSTWGDPYYVGLNGIQIYDEHGNKIPIHPNSKYSFIFCSISYIFI